MHYIDSGIPVLMKGDGDHACINGVICGYEDGGRTLLYLENDRTEPVKLDTAGDFVCDWVFIGAKKADISLADIYRRAIYVMPKFLARPKTPSQVSFGAQAFYDWADDIENGRYVSLTADTFNQWKHYTIYVCNLATNVSCASCFFIERALPLLPDLPYLQKIDRIFSQMKELELSKLKMAGGDFNVTLSALKDKQKAAQIAQIIREIGKCSEGLFAACPI
jgi:hypothetical protein